MEDLETGASFCLLAERKITLTMHTREKKELLQKLVSLSCSKSRQRIFFLLTADTHYLLLDLPL